MRKLLLLAFVVCFGCASPIVSTTVERQNVIVDKTYIISRNSDGSRNITQAYIDRYNALIDHYGDQFLPPLKHNEGIDCSRKPCTVDELHHVKAIQMSKWQRDGRPHTGTVQRLINKL